MSKIFIYAYANENLGDDLFIEILCNRYPNTKFYIVSLLNKSSAFKHIKNLKVIPAVPLVDGFFEKIGLSIAVNPVLSRFVSRFSDGIVNIGGSIFIQPKNWKKKVKYFERSIIKEKPFFVIGSNFGPYSSEEYLQEFKRLFGETTDVCFRDDYSYNLFRNLPNIRKSSDVVFSYPSKNNNSNKKNVVISVMDLSNRDKLKEHKENYKKHIVELTRRFIAKGYSVTMMGFCKNQGDEQAINEIIQMLDKNEKKLVESHIYSGDLEDSLKVIKESRFVLGSRFHAMILAWVFNKPVYPIVYSNKSINVIEDTSFEGMFSEISNLDEVDVDEVIKSLYKGNNIDVKKQVLSANDQFEKLDEFLNYEK